MDIKQLIGEATDYDKKVALVSKLVGQPTHDMELVEKCCTHILHIGA